MIIPEEINDKLINLLTNTCLLFSIPRNFDEKINAIELGITEILIICIDIIDSLNSGNITGTIIGDNRIPVIDNPIDENMVIILSLEFDSPLASYGRINL